MQLCSSNSESTDCRTGPVISDTHSLWSLYSWAVGEMY